MDLRNNRLNIGEQDPNSKHNREMEFFNYKSDGDHWIIKIRDIRYNSTSTNYSSLNDTFTRKARIDTMFPGISVPTS